ncbi:hypothetical protein JMJ77_0012085 [Colletotrichum scovillei]|uniref:Transferase family protein n=2 Tax=Colletotrichum scovillei TaxID=1209932 RepID=A0A9P7QVP3_9PEZI|nr:hypothetical protein JMJ77_0012085 [Colletotrichum scovillei]KAG7046374.1 hypothetical protein JMJ78_0011438 [Colletotrichum scovillei]KAG7063723.1 hypothetical protein JMJ76_0006181 [Colletotrichum scovillei]
MLSFQFLYRLVPTMGTFTSLLRGRVEFESGCQQQQQHHHQQEKNKKKTTPKVDVYNLHPAGWESDPEDEYHRLCTLDYCSGTIYCAYALFFKLDPGADKHRIVEVLKQGLKITLSQCRRLCGTLREDPDGGSGLCFHKRREDTVEFHVQWLDGSNKFHDDEDEDGAADREDGGDERYPSYADFERQHFSTRAFGPDLNLWCVPPMTPADKPANRPENNPKAASFKASFIPGDGLVLMMMHHHLANDVNGWAGEMRQLAENCAAIWAASASGADAGAAAAAGGSGGNFGGGGDATSTAAAAPPELPPWDPACLDLSRVTVTDPPADQLVDGPPRPSRHPEQRAASRLLFHIPRSKLLELKRLANPAPATEGSASSDSGSGSSSGSDYWISSYDALNAYLWRVLLKHKARLHKSDPETLVEWVEAVDVRRRLCDASGKPMPARTQGNVIAVAIASRSTHVVPQFTIKEVVEDAPFTKLAWYIRQLTNSITPPTIDAMLSGIAHIRNKLTLYAGSDVFPPTTLLVTDWRDADPYTADFGFGRPSGFRCPWDSVTGGLVVVYPPRPARMSPGGDDEGNEVSLAVEKELVWDLLADPEWNRVFEFRGVEVEDE